MSTFFLNMSPILLIIFFCLLVFYLYKLAKDRPPNFPPGPIRLPIWGSYWILLWNDFKFLHIAYHKLAQKYKTKILGVYLGQLPAVVVNDYELIKQVSTEPQFQGRVKLFIINERTYKKNLGIIFTDEEFWRQQRRFSLRHLRDYGFGRRFQQIEGLLEEEIKDMLDLLHGHRKDKAICSNGSAVVPDIFYSIFFNAIWFMFTGQRFPVKEHDKIRFFGKESIRFVQSIDITGNAVAFTPWLRYFAPKYFGFTDLVDSSVNMLKFFEDAVSEHMKTYSDDYVRDFIDQYIKEMKKYKENQEISSFSEEQLYAVGLDYAFPAASTATTILTFSMTFLMNYPEIQTKMQQELDAVVGRDRLPTLDDRHKLPYNEAFLREVLRRETLVPLAIVHRATEDTELGGYNIPKDTAVFLNLWSFHHDPDFWGDPEVFRPERFLDEKGEILKRDYSLPFGAGKRLCAGETFARQNMFLVLTALVQNFNVKCPPGKPLPTTTPDLPGILITKNSISVQFEPRN